jgi:hypothetical protein
VFRTAAARPRKDGETMTNPRTIEVALPDCLQMNEDDIGVLRTTFETIITLASGGSGGAEQHLARMRQEEWAVNWGLTWIARARRGSAYEEAIGGTKQEVLTQLGRLTSLHEVEGTP